MHNLPRTPEDPLHSKGAAAAMRRDLKKAFRGVKFSVKIGRGTGRAFIDCDWTDGPSEALVAGVVGFYDSRWNETLYAPIEDESGRVVSLNRTYVDAISYHRSYSKSFLQAVLAQTDYTGEQRPAVVEGHRGHRFEFSKDTFLDDTLRNIEIALGQRRKEHSDKYYGGKAQKRQRRRKTEVASGAPQPQIAEKLRGIADKMETQIQEKLNPSIGQLNVTARRAGIAASMETTGRRMQEAQSALRALAERHEQGKAPALLAGVLTKKVALFLVGVTWEPGGLRTSGIPDDQVEEAKALFGVLSGYV